MVVLERCSVVVIISNDLQQLGLLEDLLIKYNIDYEGRYSNDNIGIKPPFLKVDGVPLDFERAVKYIEGMVDNEQRSISEHY